jgi:hypothetical protein
MAMAMLILIQGSPSVGLAIYLILEFNKPYTGSIRVSPAALEQAIAELDKPGPPPPAHHTEGQRSRS